MSSDGEGVPGALCQRRRPRPAQASREGADAAPEMRDGGCDGDVDGVQGGPRGLLLHGCQAGGAAVPGLRAHAPGLQGRVQGDGPDVPVLRLRQDFKPRVVAHLCEEGLLRGAIFTEMPLKVLKCFSDIRIE